jgi:hypothetical protein
MVFMLALTAVSYGQQRTFVSAQTGSDSNTASNCALATPCRNFNAAVSVVLAGGEVVALDSGGYGPTTLTKAVTLTSPSGVYAAITALTGGSSAITVTAGSTDTVVLRGLTLTGLGGANGINVTAVGNLHVEGCIMSGFSNNGLNVALAATGSQIHVKDTISRNNAGSGISITTSAGTVGASIDNSRIERNGANGVLAGNNSLVTINRTVASGNGTGFNASSTGAAVNAELNCEECVASTNATGFSVANAAGSTATIRASNSTATSNTGVGFAQTGTGVFESLTNNLVRGNTGGNSTGTISGVPAL